MNARTLATQLQDGSTVSWGKLERAAFDEHLSVLDGRFGRAISSDNKFTFVIALVIGIALALVYLACFFSPVWGLASVYDGIIARAADAPDPETAIPQAGIFYSIAAVLMIVSTGHWLISGRPRMGFYQIQAGLALVPGLTTAFAVMRLGLENEVEDWGLWILPIVVAVVFGALFLILHYVASLEPAGPAELEDNEAEQNAVERKDRVLLARRRKRVARLSEAQRSQIRRDLADSFADLADRGLITADESRLAGEVELGGLAILGPRIAKTE